MGLFEASLLPLGGFSLLSGLLLSTWAYSVGVVEASDIDEQQRTILHWALEAVLNLAVLSGLSLFQHPRTLGFLRAYTEPSLSQVSLSLPGAGCHSVCPWLAVSLLSLSL